MKYQFVYLILMLLFASTSFSQNKYSGVWQGIIVKNGQKNIQGSVFFLQIDESSNTFTGLTREETVGTNDFIIKKIKGKINNKQIEIEQGVLQKKSATFKSNLCNLKIQLKYTDSTGYLKGTFTSLDCRNVNGTIILYRSQLKISNQAEPLANHVWFDRYVKDLDIGLYAPEIRAKERKNFNFQPVYFEYDKADIKSEYLPFLMNMVRVVEGHSDLRILVTGHTDSDGSDPYNIDLSKRRASAIIDFFISQGLSKDRIEIDFKGESLPVDNNKTPEGKQKNRRVDFQFI